MPDRELVICHLNDCMEASRPDNTWVFVRTDIVEDALELLKEQEDLLKHEYWRGYNNGRADERGLQEGTIMQTFSPD